MTSDQLVASSVSNASEGSFVALKDLGLAMKLCLRSSLPADFEALYEIDQQCYESAIAYSRREMRMYLRFPGAECVVAESDHKIIGFCITANHHGEGYIITMDVLPRYRRQGVASALLAEAEHRLQALQTQRVGLETATDNLAGIAFWERHGYRKIGLEKNYYPGGRDAYSMMKLL